MFTGQVVPQELHDQSAVLVAIILEHVQVSYRVIKCLQRASSVHHMHAHIPPPLRTRVRTYLLGQ